MGKKNYLLLMSPMIHRRDGRICLGMVEDLPLVLRPLLWR
jgi:hypothetical protein